MGTEKDRKRLAFEEFQLFYESTEKVTERRLSGNRWNYSICTAVIVAIGVVARWSLTHLNFFAVGAGIVIVLCAVAFLFCSLWIGQIRDFKMLNNAKFTILNQMAPRIAFGPPSEDDRASFSPFEREWRVMEDNKALQEVTNLKIVALKSSNVEYLLPKAFQVLFALIVILTVIGVISNLDLFVRSLSFNVSAG